MDKNDPAQPTPEQASILHLARVARLATVDMKGQPYLVPFCFTYDGAYLYTTTDAKPKSLAGHLLKRVRNILDNPRVSVLVDHYEEDWGQLYYVLVIGKAVLLEEGNEQAHALALLKDKYPQYERMDLTEEAFLRITPHRIRSWGKLPGASSVLTNGA